MTDRRRQSRTLVSLEMPLLLKTSASISTLHKKLSSVYGKVFDRRVHAPWDGRLCEQKRSEQTRHLFCSDRLCFVPFCSERVCFFDITMTAIFYRILFFYFREHVRGHWVLQKTQVYSGLLPLWRGSMVTRPLCTLRAQVRFQRALFFEDLATLTTKVRHRHLQHQ